MLYPRVQASGHQLLLSSLALGVNLNAQLEFTQFFADKLLNTRPDYLGIYNINVSVCSNRLTAVHMGHGISHRSVSHMLPVCKGSAD